MSLVTCKDCGQEVSKAAQSCPRCGRVFNTRGIGLVGGCATILMVLILVAICAGHKTTTESHATSAPPSTPTSSSPSLAGVPSGHVASSGMADYEEKAFLKTKAGRLWKKHDGAWSSDDCKAIVRHKIHIGMTTKQVLASWGNPDNVNTSQYASGLHEQWVYNDTNYVYFENGVMTALQQSH